MNGYSSMRAWLVTLAAFLAGSALTAPAQTASLPNAEFEEGGDSPHGWELSGGAGSWVERGILEVTGTGSDSNYWHCDDYPFVPGALYHFRMRARRLDGRGIVIAGPTFCNRDYDVPGEWQWLEHYCRAPQVTTGSYLRLGQWNAKGTVQFDAVRVIPALPVHEEVGSLTLGEGESVRDGRYSFHGTFNRLGANDHRPLERATAGFNSPRWTFGEGSEVVYRFSLPGHLWLSGKASLTVNYHVSGSCLLEASTDQAEWHRIGRQESVGTCQVELPAALLPAETLFLRLKSASSRSSFQVNSVEFEGNFDGDPPHGIGTTCYADVVKTGSTPFVIEQISRRSEPDAGTVLLRLALYNSGDRVQTGRLSPALLREDGPARKLDAIPVRLAAGESATFEVSVPAREPGRVSVALAVGASSSSESKVVVTFTVPDYHRADYGERLAASTEQVGLWWCDATHKVAPGRSVPAASGNAVRLSAAGNDHEAAQIVLRPASDLRELTATASPLTSKAGDTLPAGKIEILRVAYHQVSFPTDQTGVSGLWPDALPPLQEPIDLPAGRNQPLWILIHVPEDAAAGDYRGSITLRARDFQATIPLELHVWNFALPEENHLSTAFGFDPGNAYRYHQVESEQDRRQLLEQYFKCFSEHRISPYNPTPLDPIRVRFLPDAAPPRAELDFRAFDRAMQRAVDRFHFTGFRLRIEGMGSGTFHDREPPRIGEFGEESATYQALFSSYVSQLQDHLREKGWLEMAYVYWFDEPEPRDYDFVRGGMQRLQRYAPGLQRMLTEEPTADLVGAVDVWCPVSYAYESEPARQRQQQGEQIWWYVCTGPKAPYCTLFIDHPATELRVWLWQTWQRGIEGILVWQSNYWTSDAAFPEQPQDPYLDPMGYVSGYATPRGSKRFWGNGDGRFIYPPPAAATPGAHGTGPILEPPVSSIRWEMLREGIEDFELLWLLRDLLAEHEARLSRQDAQRMRELLEVPASITSSMTEFTTDPAPIYQRRADLAEAIETLLR